MQTNKQESGNFDGKDGYSPACYYISPRGICGGQIGSETYMSTGILVLPFQYHSITAPYPFINL
jgi:hypothetical protein